MYFTYILYSDKIKKFYTGHTIDPDRRLEEHNRGKTSFSASGLPWRLVLSIANSSRAEAVKLERSIKKRDAERFLNDRGISIG